MQEVIDKLEDTGKLVESQGAKIIDLSDRVYQQEKICSVFFCTGIACVQSKQK